VLHRKQVFNPYLIFDQFDTDNDGRVNADEFLLLFSAMKLDGFTAAHFNEVMKLIPKDPSG
jgi:hypothetical protein